MADDRDTVHDSGRKRLRVVIKGAVQGVGFRPFVYRLATDLALSGWVSNSAHGVVVEVEGAETVLQQFVVRMPRERPPRSFIQSFEPTYLDAVGYERFEIRESAAGEKPTTLVLPDIAVCDDCLREMRDPADRRYRYPFINCTNCGPRFSIVEGLPYDRPKTTMRGFEMCGECRGEYEDPANRRFHAQPNACPVCGPQLALWDCEGRELSVRDEALADAVRAIREGRIVAVKGLGGFHLMVDARNTAAVAALRRRKAREEKPFALMYPTLDAARRDSVVSALEERLLVSPEAPIVLLAKSDGEAARQSGDGEAVASGASELSDLVAPGMRELGVMLPYTPLHHLLLADLGFPVVATSGNLSDEPICTDEREAVSRLGAIADVFLVHNRPITRHVDDSVARLVLGRELVLRRARGYAPLPVMVAGDHPPILGVGAHLKNTITACAGAHAFVSQHIGDLETEQALSAFRRVIDDFGRLYDFTPAVVACDAHPNYLSTGWARECGLPTVAVQHHEAHVLACMAENELKGPVLGVSWDGTGFGPDGTVWGGEFLVVTEEACTRRAFLRTFALPGGDQAVKEPRRSALGALVEAFGSETLGWSDVPSVAAFTERERTVLAGLVKSGVNAPRTSSAGRLFDAVASVVGLHQRVRFEGQAAMALQAAAATAVEDDDYRMAVAQAGADCLVVDWAPTLAAIVRDVRRGEKTSSISGRFHDALARAIVDVARRVGHEQVALSGGCFQNALLLECTVARLRQAGFRPYWHQRIPPNDGGIALGQVMGALRVLRGSRSIVDSR
ncbi:MAG: carbamoyltransferase HypF [Bacteroidales bacterium]